MSDEDDIVLAELSDEDLNLFEGYRKCLMKMISY